MIEVNRYVSDLIQSNMYVIRNNYRIIIIDPFINSELTELIIRDNLIIDYTLLTHEHYDHISGVNYFKERFETKVLCSKKCAEAIKNPSDNFSIYFDVLSSVIPHSDKDNMGSILTVSPFITKADITFSDNYRFEWMGHNITLTETPGHSKGSSCILIDNKYLFCGDSLIKDFSVVTKLKGGSIIKYNTNTKPFLNSLPRGIKVYPGHFELFSLNNE